MKKLTLTIAAALISGAAYGQDLSAAYFEAYLARRDAQEAARNFQTELYGPQPVPVIIVRDPYQYRPVFHYPEPGVLYKWTQDCDR